MASDVERRRGGAGTTRPGSRQWVAERGACIGGEWTAPSWCRHCRTYGWCEPHCPTTYRIHHARPTTAPSAGLSSRSSADVGLRRSPAPSSYADNTQLQLRHTVLVQNGVVILKHSSTVTRNVGYTAIWHLLINGLETKCCLIHTEQAVREAATICPAPAKLTFDILTLKVVSESHVTWATSVPILVFLGLSVLDSGPMYATERRQTDRRQTRIIA